MSKIISLPQLALNERSKTELSLRLHSNNEIEFVMSGKMEYIIQMLYDVMESQEQATKAVITTVLIFADKKGIPLEDLKKHSFLNQAGLIVQP